jgi:hypothetical protein
MDPDLAEQGFFKKKGNIVRVSDTVVAELQILKPDVILRVHQSKLMIITPVFYMDE